MDGSEAQSGLTPAEVPATEYDTDYYLHDCMGADAWRESNGRAAAGLYDGMLDRAGFEPGMRVLDLGTGRGELLAAAIAHGAAEAVGVDYADAAVELAQKTLERAGSPPGARVVLADARRVPVDSNRFDLAMMLDVVEHLAQAELELALSEARRALRQGGKVFIHTAPNRTVYNVTYRVQRAWRPDRRRRWPADPRNPREQRMHVNEQTPRSLRRALRRAGFEDIDVRLGRWVHTRMVPDRSAAATYHRLARLPGLRRLAIIDMFASGIRPVS